MRNDHDHDETDRPPRHDCKCAVALRLDDPGLGAERGVQSNRQLGRLRAGHTGYGPGWIALTFDTGGAPHGPITGYLFHDGVAGAVGNDHFDVSSYYTRPAAGVNTLFAGGYAYGHFNGCSWSYLDSNGYELSSQGGNRTGGCTPPNHTTRIFCYDQAADPLCNAGTTSAEPEAGVCKTTSNHRAVINAGGIATCMPTSALQPSTTGPRPRRRSSSATSTLARSTSGM